MEDKVPDTRTEQARQRVIKAAAKLFMSRGIRAVTMNDVAHALKMSKRTLYELFADKEMLLIGCYRQWSSMRDKRLTDLLQHTDDVLEIILSDLQYTINMRKRIAPEFIDDIRKYPRLVEFSRQLRTEHEDGAVKFLERGIEQGLFVPDVDCRIFLHTATSMGKFISENPRLRNLDRMRVFYNTFFTYLRGITTEKGRRQLDDFASRTFFQDNTPPQRKH